MTRRPPPDPPSRPAPGPGLLSLAAVVVAGCVARAAALPAARAAR